MDNMTPFQHYAELREEKAEIEARLWEVNRALAKCEEAVLRAMEDTGVTRITVDGLTIYASFRLAAKIKSERSEAVAVIKSHWPELVKEDINLNTISAFMRELRGDGGIEELRASLPADVLAVLDVSEFLTVNARKGASNGK